MKKKSKFINRISFILLCISLFLMFKINEIKQFVSLPMIHEWIPFESWFNFKDSLVSNTNQYHHLIDHYYTNGSNTCTSLFDGIIMEVNNDNVHVLSDNGILIVYGELNGIVSKVDERILSGQIIGEFEDSLTLYFSKDNQELNYEEVMKL